MSDAHPEHRDERPRQDPDQASGGDLDRVPVPLLVAAGATLVEGVLTVIFGLTEAFSVHTDRVVMGATTGVFFLVYGGVLVGCAWGLHRIRTWARGPVLLAQLIWLGLAWNFRTGSTLPIALGLLVMAVVVLAGLLHPRSVEALESAS